MIASAASLSPVQKQIDKLFHIWCDDPDPPVMLTRLIRYYIRTKAGLWMIRDQRGDVIPLHLNESQLRALGSMMVQAAAGRPIRQRWLKSRKTGLSTLAITLFTDLCSHYPNQRALTIAHSHEALKKDIFEIAETAAMGYRYPDGSQPIDPIAMDISFNAVGSSYRARSSGATAVSAGGTPQYAHFSERPKWEQNKAETYVNVCDAVPFVPETILIDEASPWGREEFFTAWEKAHDPEDAYAALFVPWYIDERLVAEVPEGFDLTADELELQAAAEDDNLTCNDDKLAWRRMKIAEIREDKFRREYPATPEEAVRASTGIILPRLRECIIDSLPFDPRYLPEDARVGGIDFGYNDPTVILTGFYHDAGLWITKVWRASETLASEQIEGLADGHRYYCDPSGLSQAKELKKEIDVAGMHVRIEKAPRTRRAGEDVVANELRTIIRWCDTGRLHILRSASDQLIIESDTLMWSESTGKAHYSRSALTGHFDTIDALRYALVGCEGGDAKIVSGGRRASRGARKGFANV